MKLDCSGAVLALALAVAAWPLQARGDDAETGPRPGKYLILSYGAVGRPPLNLGYVILEAGGKYKVFLPGGKPSGTGEYAYEPGKKAVVWKTGPYEKEKFGGGFEVDREGKTHKIRLKRTTIATNSTDS
jgi:hypothetical protein